LGLAITRKFAELMGGTVGVSSKIERRCALAALGVDIVPVPEGPDGRIDLEATFVRLAADGIGALMVEGGAEIAASLVARDLVDEVALFDADVHVGPGGLALPDVVEAALQPAAGRFRAVGHETVVVDRLTCYRRLVPDGA
jgi:diaminohydroxyphosphoribosylaminopyrimidine deaminase/5-amino-6-(5-phosphoribosylamino)uracil reductase